MAAVKCTNIVVTLSDEIIFCQSKLIQIGIRSDCGLTSFGIYPNETGQ